MTLATALVVTGLAAPAALAADAATPAASRGAQREADGSTPLHWAAYRGDAAAVRELLRGGGDANAANNYGATPMQIAATAADVAVMRALLEGGADPESPNAEGQTALMAVARTGNVEAATLLLRHGAKVNAVERWGGQSALMWASAQHQPQMVKFLLSKGADVDARATVRDWSRRVTAEGRPKDMNRGGLTALLYAAREGCIECARNLLDGRADIDLADPDGMTPLILALMNLHWDTAKFLIDRGADVNLWDFYGQAPLYMAVDMNTLPRGGRPDVPSTDATTGLEMIALLLEKGANPNMQLKLRPPFRHAVQDRQSDLLLTTGATPLLRAARAADLPAMKLLLAHGALIDLPQEDGLTPLMAAAGTMPGSNPTRGTLKTEAEVLEAVKLLQAAGADVNAVSRRGETALHSAAARGWNDVVKALAGLGARLDAQEKDDLTPLDYAMGRYRVGFLVPKPPARPETAAVLRQLGAKLEHPNLPPWPAVSTPTITAQVPLY